jgi:hypothetical protein
VVLERVLQSGFVVHEKYLILRGEGGAKEHEARRGWAINATMGQTHLIFNTIPSHLEQNMHDIIR